MRGSGPRARSLAITIDVRKFGWDRAVLATLRHSTLPFGGEVAIDATPLSEIAELGKRDRLSLLAQFAAHEAFLQFAGVTEGELDAAEWAVVQKRGCDCRLVRVASRRTSGEPIPILSIVQQFAAAIESPPVDVLRQPSARAEAVYCEIDGRLRGDAAADLRWFRASAIGEIAAPGIDALRMLLTAATGTFRFEDPQCIASLRAASDDALILGDESSPLHRYSGLTALRSIVRDLDSLTESEIVERVIEAAGRQRLMFAVANCESLDPNSRKVIDLLLASEVGVWIGPSGSDLPVTSWFVASPRLSARHELERRLLEIPHHLRRAKLEQFRDSACFARYLVDGVLPSPQIASPTSAVREPARSYLAAIALLGTTVRLEIAQHFLRELSSSAQCADLLFDGVSSIAGGFFAFSSDDMRDSALEHLPAASRAALSRTAAEVLEQSGELRRAALLLLDSDDVGSAARLLEQIDWESADDAIRTLRSIRPDALSPRIARTLANALMEEGRYRDAREMLPRLTEDDRELLMARIGRRTGDYSAALRHAERLSADWFEVSTLRAEVLSLIGRRVEAAELLSRCHAQNDDQRIQLGYQQAVIANDRGVPANLDWLEVESPLRDYYAARFNMYRSIAARDVEGALQRAREAMAAARTTVDRIDATLDYLFAFFCSGQWAEARPAALDAMLIVDETQGDRAAGGILYMLAYLCADEGQWAHAAHLLERLRNFYTEVHDDQRLLELDLIAAHLDFSHGRFEASRAAAETILDATMPDQIREAAALIVDEIASISRRNEPLRSRGNTANVELTDRFMLLRARRGDQVAIRRPFIRALSEWERCGGPPPAANSRSELLMLFRAALACERRYVAEPIARQMNIALEETAPAQESELRIIRVAATRDFPFGSHDFGSTRWRFATRNRLGQWQEIGSFPAIGAEELDSVLEAGAPDWTVCSDHELLYFAGLRNWSVESRDALAAVFRTRAEHYRLRRIVEQEEGLAARGAESVDGIVGQSPVIRDVFALIGRVARRDVPVCILGESGTGKELVARALHRQSSRKQKLFTTVNCAALPENLIESELFGCIRGAFTGADRDRAGLIEVTDGGTLFLDEIGEMPLAAQAKLLRFLQEGEFRRVGDASNRTADVRIVTSTNRKLETAVEQGRFREDLYYRIRGIEIVLPPLRDRAGDIGLLAAYFVAQERASHRTGPLMFSAEAEAAFLSYHWPGNVRELQNTIRAAHAIAGEAKEIDLDHLPERIRGVKLTRKSAGSYQDAVARFRRELIEKSLMQAKGNQNQAAALLKISRQALAYQIRELGILVTPPKPSRL